MGGDRVDADEQIGGGEFVERDVVLGVIDDTGYATASSRPAAPLRRLSQSMPASRNSGAKSASGTERSMAEALAWLVEHQADLRRGGPAIRRVALAPERDAGGIGGEIGNAGRDGAEFGREIAGQAQERAQASNSAGG